MVTANKALLAQSTGELAQAAERARLISTSRRLSRERSRSSGPHPVFGRGHVVRVAGIVNGTTTTYFLRWRPPVPTTRRH